jgi:hypothetical protein
MVNLIIAYVLIFAVLVGYGISLRDRAGQVDKALRTLDKK